LYPAVTRFGDYSDDMPFTRKKGGFLKKISEPIWGAGKQLLPSIPSLRLLSTPLPSFPLHPLRSTSP